MSERTDRALRKLVEAIREAEREGIVIEPTVIRRRDPTDGYHVEIGVGNTDEGWAVHDAVTPPPPPRHKNPALRTGGYEGPRNPKPPTAHQRPRPAPPKEHP